MSELTLDTHLEATNMGSNQQLIAEHIMNSDRWLNYVATTNEVGVPEDEQNPGIPTDGWCESQTFNPDDLIPEACLSLGWHSVPQVGGLIMKFIKCGPTLGGARCLKA